MTIYSLAMREEQFGAIRDHFIRPDGLERAGYLLCRSSLSEKDPWERQAHERFLVTSFHPVPEADLVESTETSVTWLTRSFVRMLKEAERTGQIVAVVHNHPAHCPDFSHQDDQNEPDLLQAAINRNGPGARILSVLITPDNALTGRIWLHPSRSGIEPLSMIKVIGSQVAIHYANRRSVEGLRAFHRQALAFGSTLNNDLSKLRVGIVGCGGTGSAVAMLLARLGVGQIALFDQDVVDRTNLNRLHGSRQSDADAMLPKVDVVAREIAAMGLGVRVARFNAWVGDPACRDALKSCDVLFGCTDDHDGRMFLNRFAYYYLTPVVDIGLAIDVSDSDPPSISALDARVTVLGPGATCLLCRGTIDPAIATAQALRRVDPIDYERRKAEAYVQGEGNPSPAVVTFTTELACMGVNELIHRMQGFRGEGGSADCRVRKFHLNEDRRLGRKPNEWCGICGNDEIWGHGDTDPFLGRVN